MSAWPRLFADELVVLRGGGDLATGVAARLHRAGFPLIVTELAWPLVVRRTVALATAVFEGTAVVEDLRARRVAGVAEALRVAPGGDIPVLVSPELPANLAPSVIVDARVAKRNIDTRRGQAPLVVALGPGFVAGLDCHAVVETKRGHDLGRVIWEGPAAPNTGTPGRIGGKGLERVLRAPREGIVNWQVEIGKWVEPGEVLGQIGISAILAPFAGVVRGLVKPGTRVAIGAKIGDVDARADRAACFTISDKALAVGGGVLEAVLTHLNRRGADGR